MAVTESKIKAGTLTLKTEPFSTKPTNIKIVPASSSGDPEEVLSGDSIGGETTDSDTLQMSVIQDFTDAAGIIAFSWMHRGEVVPFTWKPTAAAAEWTGMVEVTALEVGGDVNKRLKSEASWKITSMIPPVGFKPLITSAGTNK